MTKDEALKLALEALENLKEVVVAAQVLGIKAGATGKNMRLGESFIHDEAITAIKEALAQPWPDLTEQQRESYQKGHNDGVAHHKQAVKAAQPEQEPSQFGSPKMQALILANLAQPEQEPAAWMYPDDLKRFETSEAYAQAYSIAVGSPTQGKSVPLYTTPPKEQQSCDKRTWVDLTDEQIEQRIGYRLPAYGFDAIRQLIKENT